MELGLAVLPGLKHAYALVHYQGNSRPDIEHLTKQAKKHILQGLQITLASGL